MTVTPLNEMRDGALINHHRVIVIKKCKYGNVVRVQSKYVVLGDGPVQSLVHRVQRKGLRTQPCGASVLVVMVGDVAVPTLTVCGLSGSCVSSG